MAHDKLDAHHRRQEAREAVTDPSGARFSCFLVNAAFDGCNDKKAQCHDIDNVHNVTHSLQYTWTHSPNTSTQAPPLESKGDMAMYSITLKKIPSCLRSRRDVRLATPQKKGG